MRTLEVLLKRANRQMEELAGHANTALSAYNRLLTEKAMCEAATATEAALVDGSPLAGLGYAAFLDRQKARMSELELKLNEADQTYQSAKTALMQAFAEVKKLEALLARQKREEAVARDKAEQAAFDERSSQTFGRH